MTSKIANIANMAFQVFSGVSQHSAKTASLSREQITRLAQLVNSITPQDVGFDHRWLTDPTFHAPVIYVHIMENEVFSMGIFVVRPGSRIPLHDHPGMHGVAKVLYGALRCRSFSKVDLKPGDLPLSRWQLNGLVSARPHHDLVMTPKTEACILTPHEGNFHEMQAVDGGAAFLDILAPPYDHDLGTRECKFYKEVTLPRQPLHRNNADGSSQQNNSHVPEHNTSAGAAGDWQTHVFLVETHQPKDYWCDPAEYRGPKVS